MNYKVLKKVIKAAERTRDADSASAQKEAFFRSLDSEVEKVNAFYLLKEAALRDRMAYLTVLNYF